MTRKRDNEKDDRQNSVLPDAETMANSASMPMSGTEPPFTDVTYGTRKGIGNNNCYGYAIGDFRGRGNRKLQPGNLSGATTNLNLSSCNAVVSRALRDLKNMGYTTDPDVPCKKGYHKTMAFLAKDNDYHWYRQHKDALVTVSNRLRDPAKLSRVLGVKSSQVYMPSKTIQIGQKVLVKNAGLWSHKQGFATGPLLKDACGRAIKDPRKACRRYSDKLDYTQFCGAMCVRSAGGVTPKRRTATTTARPASTPR